MDSNSSDPIIDVTPSLLPNMDLNSSDPIIDVTPSLIPTQSPTNSNISSSIGVNFSNALQVIADQITKLRVDLDTHRIDLESRLKMIDQSIISNATITALESKIDSSKDNNNDTHDDVQHIVDTVIPEIKSELVSLVASSNSFSK